MSTFRKSNRLILTHPATCQLSLWEETWTPWENPRLSAECWQTLLNRNHDLIIELTTEADDCAIEVSIFDTDIMLIYINFISSFILNCWRIRIFSSTAFHKLYKAFANRVPEDSLSNDLNKVLTHIIVCIFSCTLTIGTILLPKILLI
jgi:hypothetical protein